MASPIHHKQDAGRIRERFLHKIGIAAPPPSSAHHKDTDDADGRASPISNSAAIPPPAHPSLCLGGVKPIYEPLKVCLDDDSSVEDEDMFDDEDFFIGSDDDFEAMAVDTVSKVPLPPKTLGVSSSTCSIPHYQLSQPSHGPQIVSDCEVSTSSSATDMSSMAASSSGNLTYLSQDSSLSKSKRDKAKRRVSLDNNVAILPIPMRTEYSDHIRGCLWSSATELYQNAARNSIEFAAEGWNWRNVMEDDNMFVCSQSGELIHPVHLYNVMQLENESGIKEGTESLGCAAEVAAVTSQAVATDASQIPSPPTA